MRLLSWIILLPVALAVAAFSAVNRVPVALDLWPLPFTPERPVYRDRPFQCLRRLCLGGSGGLDIRGQGAATRHRPAGGRHRE